MTWPRVVAATSTAAAVACWVLGGVGVAEGLRTDLISGFEVAWYGVGIALGSASLVLGLVIAWRRPHNAVGGLLCTVGLAIALMTGAETYAYAAATTGDLPLPAAAVSLMAGSWVWFFVPIAALALVFPDGRLLSARWRWVAYGLPVVGILFTVGAAFEPGPYEAPFDGYEPAFGTMPPVLLAVVGIPLTLSIMGLLVASAVSVVRRYRRSSGIERAQVGWFLLAAVSVPLTLLLCWVSYLVLGGPDLVVVGLVLMFVAVPTATAIGIMRHDLYDVDRALTTAVTYSLVSGVLLSLFTAIVAAFGVVMGRSSPVATAVATAACALVLAPLARTVRRRVDRRLYPMRRRTLDALADLRVRTQADQGSPEELEVVLRRSLDDPLLRVGYVPPGATTLVDASGAALRVSAGSSDVPVMNGSTRVGVIVPSRHLSKRLGREIADASGLLVEMVRLRLQLSRALEDVDESRARIVQAGMEERRRLVRDLHDGSQQRLVALGMSLRIAQRHLADGQVDVDAVLDQAVAELGTAVAELRQLAQGIRPSSLDDGLGPALTSLVGTLPLDVVLDVDERASAEDLPDELTTTAYFVATEAVTNAVKHADAGRIGVRVRRDDAAVEVLVVDDGRGGALLSTGSGLTSLSDRVRALGGSLRIDSPAGSGTTVTAVLPCAS